MSFLDNLENTLKSLENAPSGENAAREQTRRDADAAAQRAVAPWAERLRKSPFTASLLSAATREGFKQRVKVHITWIGTTLRLDARERRLELRPMPDGVETVYLENGEIRTRSGIDLTGDPAELVHAWLTPAP